MKCILFLLVILTLIGCSDTIIQEEVARVPIKEASGRGNSGAWLLKNEQLNLLMPENAYANSISIIDNNILISGSWFHDTLDVACYWLNNIRYDIDTSAITSDACSWEGAIFVSGYNWINNKSTACYWINNQRMDLTPEVDAVANSIYVDETGVYLCGQYFDADDKAWVACYWKNGVINKLSGKWSKAKKIIVKNGTVYVIGEMGNSDYTYTACYWKDSELKILSNKPSQANDIGFSGNNLYICGSNDYHACYWLNDNLINLSPGNEYSLADIISIDRNDIYIFGYKDEYGFWKNSEWNKTSINDLMTDAVVKNGNRYVTGNGPTSVTDAVTK